MTENLSPAPDNSAREYRTWGEHAITGSSLILAMLIFLGAKHPQLLTTAWHTLTDVQVYAAAYGAPYYLGILLMLVLRELGPCLAVLTLGLKFRWWIFIPFLGSWASLRGAPKNAWTEAVVGLSGPVWGTFLALMNSAVFHFTGDPFYLAIANTGYLVNLICLLPLLPFEGGRIAPALAPPAWLAGLVSLVLLLAHQFDILLFIVFGFGVVEFIHLLRDRFLRRDPEATTFQRVVVAVSYFVLALLLSWMLNISHESLAVITPEAVGD